MKRVCIVLFLCSAAMACTRENTVSDDWRETRFVAARLTGAKWQPKAAPTLERRCDEPVDSRDKALNLLVVAGGECLNRAIKALERYAKDDLAAAYLIRFERGKDPIDLLRALETAKGFNRALAYEHLGLTRQAILAWDEVVRERSDWSREALARRKRLDRVPDPLAGWSAEDLHHALKRKDVAALRKLVRPFPVDAARIFENSDLRDRDRARLFATVLAEVGDQYPMAVVAALDHPRDAVALQQGLRAFKEGRYARAVPLLERAGNPLHISARYFAFAPGAPMSMLDGAIRDLKPSYREIGSRIYILRAHILEQQGRYLDAHADYTRALEFAEKDPTATAATLSRRSANYATIGDLHGAFRDAHRAIGFLDQVVDVNTRNLAYGSGAMAALKLRQRALALHYQDTAVENVQRAVIDARARQLAHVKLELAYALRQRAEIAVAAERIEAAREDLVQAVDLAEAARRLDYRDLLRMRVHDVHGQSLTKTRPADAAVAFTQAIAAARQYGHDPTYVATLHFQRAAAHRQARDRRAADDIAEAMKILRKEVASALATDPMVASEPLWDPYFSRFREMHLQLIKSHIEASDAEGALVHAELARAFEPMQILLGVRPIQSVAELRQAAAALPADTVILQYLVLPTQTYTWVITREGVAVRSLRANREQVEGWVNDALTAVPAGLRESFTTATRAMFTELFRGPLDGLDRTKTRIVIVPDQTMYGFPFNGLVGTSDEGFLIERASIATSGSTSLYLHELARNQGFSPGATPSVLLIGNPPVTEGNFVNLEHAEAEVEELARKYYRTAESLIGPAATVDRFLSKAKTAGIIHFAGHAVANQQSPWGSRLLLASDGKTSGELSAQRLMKELPSLKQTRLVVLGACSTASGAPVGPQGLAPLVRPFIAAGVPAVIGTLWNVGDASSKELLVSLHCHYRHGDDVAVALRNAQLERLRKKNDPTNHAIEWAAFQVVGYAASPYAPPVALENPSSEHVCSANSLHGPDGLHPQ